MAEYRRPYRRSQVLVLAYQERTVISEDRKYTRYKKRAEALSSGGGERSNPETAKEPRAQPKHPTARISDS